jgi:long-subunit acyl-CoA synthetase (AMP-forming)
MQKRRKEVAKWVLAQLKEQEGDLNGFEKVKAVHVDVGYDENGVVWTEGNHLMTASQKLRRKQLTQHYSKALNQLYADLGHGAQQGEHLF